MAPFAVLQLGVSEADSQMLAAAYWGSIMLGRLVCIPASVWLSPAAILTVAIGGSALTATAMAWTLGEPLGPGGGTTLWGLTVVFGVLMAPQVRAHAVLKTLARQVSHRSPPSAVPDHNRPRAVLLQPPGAPHRGLLGSHVRRRVAPALPRCAETRWRTSRRCGPWSQPCARGHRVDALGRPGWVCPQRRSVYRLSLVRPGPAKAGWRGCGQCRVQMTKSDSRSDFSR